MSHRSCVKPTSLICFTQLGPKKQLAQDALKAASCASAQKKGKWQKREVIIGEAIWQGQTYTDAFIYPHYLTDFLS